MNTISAAAFASVREEWSDADFELPEGSPLHHDIDAEYNKGHDDAEDWDVEMDLGKTGGAKAQAVVAERAARSKLSDGPTQIINIRPPRILDDDEDDEGASTIKATAIPKTLINPLPPAIEDDFEDAFALPSDLTQLSLAPLTLNHRSSKNSLEWGDKDQTSSSQSSDACSSFGFADTSPSSNSASSVSQPNSGAEDEDDDCELEGLVIPTSLFESLQGAKQLNKILEMKKTAQIFEDRIKVASPDVEDDFEMGLIIEDDVDLSPSRLMLNSHQQRSKGPMKRSESLPARSAPPLPPLSRSKDRAKSPINPPQSSMRQFQKLRLSPSPPLRSITRSQTFQSLASPPLPASSNFLTPKTPGLRNQKSHSGLKPPSPPSTLRRTTRKASLSSLFEATQLHTSSSGSSSSGSSNKSSRYGAPTASSRARTHTSSTSRISSSEFTQPPVRPSTPSSNPAALRLTMPTLSRTKHRVPLSAVFGAPPTVSPNPRASPPLPLRPPSVSGRAHSPQKPSSFQPTAKVLRRPKRQRLYGDGTELDGIDDLPTDRDKETRFRVHPKGYGNRVPGGTYSAKSFEKDITKKKGRRNDSTGSGGNNALAPATSTNTGIEFPPTPDVSCGKKKNMSSHGHSRRKPTLIRNLSGTSAPKVVGDMKWNPHTLRWEGNENVLRDFDVAVGTSTRPALITQLTGSSMGSPANSFASGARIVGNMIFDPTRMCWISTLPPEEDEPDVFADLADDEEEGDGWETKGGTIRPIQPQGVTSSDASTSSLDVEASLSSRHSKTLSESGSDRGSRASMVYDVDEGFWETCRVAEERHRFEMKWWKPIPADASSGPDRSSLYEIRALATRKYES